MDKVEYYGEMLRILEISRKELIERTTLIKKYKLLKDIYQAVEECKRVKRTKIEYYGEMLTIKDIALKESIHKGLLGKRYNEYNDIYQAVAICKENQLKERTVLVDYNGVTMTLPQISKLLNIPETSLKTNYAATKDIYLAIEETKRKQLNKIFYKGKYLTIKEIAAQEDVYFLALKKYYEEFRNIEKAVTILKAKNSRRHLQKKYSTKSLAEALECPEDKVIKEISASGTDDLLKEKARRKDTIKITDEISLYQYAVANHLNYSVIYCLIKYYNLSIDEAIQFYKKNGQHLPKSFVYKKYGYLFKHLLINYGIDYKKIIVLITKENLSMNEALEKYCFLKQPVSNILKNWCFELWKIFEVSSEEEKSEIISTFDVNQKELDIIESSVKQRDFLLRQLLLFDIKEVISFWSLEDIQKILEEYHISDEELKKILYEISVPFNENILSGEDSPERNKMLLLSELCCRWNDLSLQERNTIVLKNKLTEEDLNFIERQVSLYLKIKSERSLTK